MFCQSQVGIDNISGTLQKKRKLDLSESNYPLTEHYHINHRVFRNVQNGNKSPTNVQHFSHNFIHASTIKLLDTYQRCGQKVYYYAFAFKVYKNDNNNSTNKLNIF